MSQNADIISSKAAKVSTEGLERRPRSLWSNAWRQFRYNKTAMFGLSTLIILVFATLVGPFLYVEDSGVINFALKRNAPSLEHPFGTNEKGQDQLGRSLNGGRVSIAVGLAAMLVGITLGTTVGALSGYFGGSIDWSLMRITELFLSLPLLPVLLMTIYLFRDPLRELFGLQLGVFLLIVVLIGGLNWMGVARIVRAQFLEIKHKEFVEAAHCVGVRTPGIIMHHILPNVLSPVIVAATLSVGSAIVTESTLSFLGLGFPPDFPTWGRMLLDGQDYLTLSPHIAFFPGLMIFLTVLSINYVGDGLRDALDPRKTR